MRQRAVTHIMKQCGSSQFIAFDFSKPRGLCKSDTNCGHAERVVPPRPIFVQR